MRKTPLDTAFDNQKIIIMMISYHPKSQNHCLKNGQVSLHFIDVSNENMPNAASKTTFEGQ